jgi:hypothetical protein
MPINDGGSLGRSIRQRISEKFAERAKHPQIEPDDETRRIVREIHAKFARFGPKQVAAQAEWKYGADLNMDMVRGALAELEAEREAGEDLL